MTIATGYAPNRSNLGSVLHWFAVRAAVYFAVAIGSSILFLAGSAVYVAFSPAPDDAPPIHSPTRTNAPPISVPQEVFPKDGLVAGNDGGEAIAASKLLGLKIYGPGAEKIGQISEVYMDRRGKAEAVVVSLDGSYWAKKKWIAIPFKDVDLIFDKSPNITKIDRGVVPYGLPYLEHLPPGGSPFLPRGGNPADGKNNN
jgi:sporulation protein YlmC with PRC-barrel domain